MADRTEFVRRYDRQIVGAARREFFAGSDYYNVGYWSPGTRSQNEACRNLVQRLVEMLPGPVESVLDVACGLGATLRQLSERLEGARVTGIDLSLQQVARARRTARNARHCRMDAARMAFARRSFDALFCVEAAFHFDTREDFLREAHRILKPGGSLILSDILFTDTSWIGDWMVPEANREKDLDSYVATLRRAGFQTVQSTDATDPCWRSFCRQMRRRSRQQHADGLLDEEDYRRQLRRIAGLEHDCVDQYLLVWARSGLGNR